TNPEASSTVCQGPGDVEITDTPPPRTFYPYGSPPPTLADRERAETSLYQGRINDGNRTETPRAHARGARDRGGDRHRTASGRRRTVGRAAATAAWAV